MILSSKISNFFIVLKNRLIWFLLYIINFPFLILIILINPIIKIRITELETRSIGHYSVSTEIFLSELEKKIYPKKKNIFLWFVNKKISNYFLLKKWEKKLIIGPRIVLYPLFRMINKIEILKFLKTPFRHWRDLEKINRLKLDRGNKLVKFIKSKNYLKSLNELNQWQIRDKYKVLKKTKPFISFEKSENFHFEAFLKKIGTKKNKYICFFGRTHHFRNERPSSRDTDINNQIPGIVKLCKSKNYKAIRLGDSKQSKIQITSKQIFDYSKSKYKSDMLDIFLPMNCKYMIGSLSGISFVPILNRKKVMMIDFSQLHDINYSPDDYIPIIVPIKYRKISEHRILNYSEVFQKRLTEIQYNHELKKMGYETVLNTKDEIYSAIKEMENLIKNKKDSIDNNKLQKKFWKILSEYYCVTPPRNLRVSNSFLKKNAKIIN